MFFQEVLETLRVNRAAGPLHLRQAVGQALAQGVWLDVANHRLRVRARADLVGSIPQRRRAEFAQRAALREQRTQLGMAR